MITLDTPITVTHQIVSFEINEYNDSPVGKRVSASVKITLDDATTRIKDLVLWTDAAYDAIGQWTDADAAARITELLTA